MSDEGRAGRSPGSRDAVDAIVVGAGPNGLVAANVLADAGWNVLLLEANGAPGGAVRTEELTAPGFRNDVFSAFYPFTAASPVMRALELDRFGLRWTHAHHVLAHPRRDAPAAILDRDLDVTAANLDRDAPGDGDAYRRMYAGFAEVATPLLASLLSPFPPVRASARLARAAGLDGLRDLARLALVPLRRFVQEEFAGVNGPLLVAGSALHADFTPETAGSAIFGWLLTCLGQHVGFPVPVGGAGAITDALVSRAGTRGVHIRCDARVDRVVVERGRAVGVTVDGGELIPARYAVLADCDATQLLLSMVGPNHLPASVVARMHRVQRSSATFKVDWALTAPLPWADPDVRRAGTVHVAASVDELSVTATQLAIGQIPADPFLLIGQMTTTDPTRSPPGTESAWAYTHVPMDVCGDAGPDGIEGRWHDEDRRLFTARMEQRIERLAPGFQSLIAARHVLAPPDLEARNANLVGGDISGGTAQLHQQLVFRPIPGVGRPETPVRRLYLASASAHPGGAVHGACGANA
ncbi:MAG: NAD(P)/FAD-dependent oxidoreductase, partial [Actinomycetota bacterium]|nr:NAD(P)/FAD-dependent oxidoreductase [Actinomycetota bacterium]